MKLLFLISGPNCREFQYAKNYTEHSKWRKRHLRAKSKSKFSCKLRKLGYSSWYTYFLAEINWLYGNLIKYSNVEQNLWYTIFVLTQFWRVAAMRLRYVEHILFFRRVLRLTFQLEDQTQINIIFLEYKIFSFQFQIFNQFYNY